MITVNNKFHIPNQWEELSPSQFCNVGKALRLLEMGEVDFPEFKLLVIYALLEENPKPQPQNDTYCENLFRISEHITFPYKFVYPDEKFQNFPQDIRQWLGKHLPADTEDPFLRIAAGMDRYVEPDLHFAKQLVPLLPGTNLKGYTFSVTGQVVNTTLTAQQYIDANTMLQQYHSSRDISFLEDLARILYCPAPYNNEKMEKISLKKVGEGELYAVMYNYMAIVNWISALPKYDILFHSPSKKDGKNPLGPNAPLYTLAGKGYGSLNEVSAMPLFSYLDLLLKQTADAVLQLKSIGKKKGEVASELNLTIEQINTIL